MRMCIEEARGDDLPGLLDLYRHLHPAEAADPRDPALQHAWKELLDDPRAHCFLARLDDAPVGSCILAIIPNLTRGARPYGLIENVITHPDHRRKGIGTRLLRHALEIAWSQRCYTVMLLTGREGLHGFYEQAGFHPGLKAVFVAYPDQEH